MKNSVHQLKLCFANLIFKATSARVERSASCALPGSPEDCSHLWRAGVTPAWHCSCFLPSPLPPLGWVAVTSHFARDARNSQGFLERINFVAKTKKSSFFHEDTGNEGKEQMSSVLCSLPASRCWCCRPVCRLSWTCRENCESAHTQKLWIFPVNHHKISLPHSFVLSWEGSLLLVNYQKSPFSMWKMVSSCLNWFVPWEIVQPLKSPLLTEFCSSVCLTRFHTVSPVQNLSKINSLFASFLCGWCTLGS